MYQINKRSASVNFPEAEITEVNENLKAIQLKHGVVFSTFKDLILHLISVDLAEIPEIKTAVMPENALILTENQKIIELNETITAEIAENSSISLTELFTQSIENSKKSAEIKEIEVPVLISENQLLINFSENPERKRELLLEISRRRAEKYNTDLEPIEELAEKLLFNDGTVFNLGGEFYTGF